MSSKKNTRPSADSPYLQDKILADSEVLRIANELRVIRPSLRQRSSVLRRLPFVFSAVYKEASLTDWLQPQLGNSRADKPDSLLVRYFCFVLLERLFMCVCRNSRSTLTGMKEREYIRIIVTVDHGLSGKSCATWSVGSASARRASLRSLTIS